MVRQEIKISYQKYDGLEDLPAPWAKLVQKAREIAGNAYAPYSGFRVGAAVLLSNGLIITGNNQENAAYPSGLCAERTALFYANANYPDCAVEAIAITALAKEVRVKDPVSPCGGCRQVLLETEERYNHLMKIILDGEDAIYIIDGANALLPMSFGREALSRTQ